MFFLSVLPGSLFRKRELSFNMATKGEYKMKKPIYKIEGNSSEIEELIYVFVLERANSV